MGIIIEILTFIWTWYLPGFLGSLLFIGAWNYDFDTGPFKVYQLLLAILMAFLGPVVIIYGLVAAFLITDYASSYVPDKYKSIFKEFLNQKL